MDLELTLVSGVVHEDAGEVVAPLDEPVEHGHRDVLDLLLDESGIWDHVILTWAHYALGFSFD